MDSIESAIADIAHGKMVIVLDDEDRENEGDLVMAAEKCTPEAINFMRKEAGGLICVPLTSERLDELQIPNMVHDNTAPLGTAFSVSVEARGRVTTGISAQDRSNTILALLDPEATAGRFLAARPHVSAARARRRRARARGSDRSVGRSRAPRGSLPGRRDLRDHGRRRLDDAPDGLREFAEEARSQADHRQDLIAYRLKHEKLV